MSSLETIGKTHSRSKQATCQPFRSTLSIFPRLPQKPSLGSFPSPENDLIAAACQAAAFAYCPYSHFRVGASALADGKIFSGCNIENASLGLTICAERVAVFTAVASGHGRITQVAISCPDARPDGGVSHHMPCGACRQVMAEFGDATTKIHVAHIGTFQLGELLQHGFRL